MSIKLNVSGLDETVSWLNEIPQAIREEVAIELEHAAAYIADYARSIAPVVTGHYQALIHYERIGEMEFAIMADADYSAIIEFGSEPHFILPRNVFATGAWMLYF